MAKAIFAMGCFWKPEAVFRQVRGVTNTAVGYCGGHTENPSYSQVCAGGTGHAEAVQVEYDPAVIDYEGLLQIFWSNHTSGSLAGGNLDTDSQYRSAIFCLDENQLRAVRASLQAQPHGEQTATQIERARPFYKAEEYHQRYLEKQGRVG